MLIIMYMFTVITFLKTKMCLLCIFQLHWLYYNYDLSSGKYYGKYSWNLVGTLLYKMVEQWKVGLLEL